MYVSRWLVAQARRCTVDPYTYSACIDTHSRPYTFTALINTEPKFLRMAPLVEGHYAILLSSQQKAKMTMVGAHMYDTYVSYTQVYRTLFTC